MLNRAIIVCLSILVLTVVVDTTHAASTSPGKLAVYASTSGVMITEPAETVVTATIARGRKKRVLEVELSAVLTGAPEVVGAISLIPIVNGLLIMEPTNTGTTMSARMVCGDGPFGCTLTAQFWLDLENAEAAHPGMFLKQPLVIDGQAGWGLIGGPPIPAVSAVVSLRARLQKK